MSIDTQEVRSSGLRLAILIAIIVTVLAWASSFVVIRGVAPYFTPGALALGRVLVGSALLSLLVIGRRWVRPGPREWLLIVVFGAAWSGAYNVTLNIAEQTLDAGTTAMLVNIGPILIAVGAGIFLGEGIPKWLAIGAAVAFSGVILIGIGTGTSEIGDGSGVWWALAAAACYSIGVLCQKPAMKRLPAAQVTWLGCLIGAIACLPFGGQLLEGVADAPGGALIGVVYLGAVPTALAFSTWAYALARMPAGQLGVTTYVVPALVVLFGWLLLAEIPVPLAIVGGVVCLLGVAVSRKPAGAAVKRVPRPADI